MFSSFRTATARGKAEQADMAADHAREDSDIAQATAKQFAPDFKQPGLDRLKTREPYRIKPVPEEQLPLKSILQHSQQNDITANQNQIPNQVPTHNPTMILPQKPQQQQQIQQSVYNKKPPEVNQINQIPNQIPPPTNLQSNHTIPPNPPNADHIDLNQNHQQHPTQNQIRKSNTSLNRIPNNPDQNPQSFPTNNPNNPTLTALRRGSKLVNEKPSLVNSQQPSIDHFDHYKRPPSRDSSVDRYSKAAGRMGGLGSRQSSVDKTSVDASIDARSVRGPSATRGTTPLPTGNGSVLTGSGVNR